MTETLVARDMREFVEQLRAMEDATRLDRAKRSGAAAWDLGERAEAYRFAADAIERIARAGGALPVRRFPDDVNALHDSITNVAQRARELSEALHHNGIDGDPKGVISCMFWEELQDLDVSLKGWTDASNAFLAGIAAGGK